MDEYLFITLAKLRSDASRLQARNSAKASGQQVRPRYQLEEAAAGNERHSYRARWYLPHSEHGEQS